MFMEIKTISKFALKFLPITQWFKCQITKQAVMSWAMLQTNFVQQEKV